MSQTHRRILAAVFVFCAALCGFGIGAWVGSKFLVPPGSGLVGPFMVLGYGITGSVIGLGLGLVASWLLRGRAFHVVSIPVIVAGVSLAALMGRAILESQNAQETYLANQRAALPAFDLTLAFGAGRSEEDPFTRFDYDGASHRFSVTRHDGGTCQGTLSPGSEEKLSLLVALRHVEELLLRTAQPCADDTAALIHLEFLIREHKPPNTRGAVNMNEQCVAAHEELDDAVSTIESVYDRLAPSCL